MNYEKYKKKYKNALAHAREIHRNEEEKRKDMEFLFPELKESEDEKIRKALISILKSDFEKDTTIFGISVEQIIAWLEKQGEKPIINGKEFTASENFGYFEEKSVDTVEPKFKVGDWITNGDYTWKIVEVKPLDYILQSQDGNIVDDTISHVDEQFHSFTIKDARDGDVLALSYASQNYILIYKGLHQKNFGIMMSVFCSYYVEENRYNDETDNFHAMNCGEIITPATKEQRGQLEKAMADAGYTFDFEKKELKEIEQKPTDNDKIEALRTEYEKGRADAIAKMQVAWSEKYIADVFEKVGLAKIVREQSNDNLTNALQDAMIELSKFTPQPKQEWSEEDESILQGIWDEILANKHQAKEYEWKTYDKFLNWLKSLKDRVQPKIELTQLDKNILEAAIAFVEQNNHFNCWRGVDKHTVLSALHSLRPQNNWKPSDEQMKALCFVKKAKILDPEERESLNSLYIHLRKLKE